MKQAKGDNRSLQHKLSNFLFKYRTTPHTSTSETPAKLLYGRNLRTRLDCIKPDISSRVLKGQDKMKLASHCGSKVRQFKIGQQVMVRDYRGLRKWVTGQIVQQTGALSYKVNTGNGNIWRHHTDQVRATQVTAEPEPEVLVPSSTLAPPVNLAPPPANPVPTANTAPPATLEVVTPPTNSVPTETRRYPKRENIRAPVKLNL
ncbi:uncharacterized protein K02A2.6-like [Pecten maximus]|uniref:uncharacterized protein K02A2.6-like n=1 Tax=Pecten maximus TaxID=6579 RepID=UPI001457F223|nr:uncharacterized protein K02A2.6-like [Pecten maximus]